MIQLSEASAALYHVNLTANHTALSQAVFRLAPLMVVFHIYETFLHMGQVMRQEITCKGNLSSLSVEIR